MQQELKVIQTGEEQTKNGILSVQQPGKFIQNDRL